ncbi:MAG: tetratricopeptide repeat protein [Candidatus Eisenbacteria bacterium]
MASVSEILKTAREYERKGDWDGAAAEYRKLQEMDPCPPIAYNLMGDLFHRKGDGEEAYRWYQEAVGRYAQEGLYGNAIGVCRKILRQYPEREEVSEQLGGLFFSQGLSREAVKHYMNFTVRAAESGDSEAVVRTAGRVREILADDAGVRERLGEIFVSLSLPDEGVRDLQAALETYRQSGKDHDAERVTARLREVEPTAKADPLSLMDEKDPSLRLTTAGDPVRPEHEEGVETLEPLDHSRIESMAPRDPMAAEPQGTGGPENPPGESGAGFVPEGFSSEEIEILDPRSFAERDREEEPPVDGPAAPARPSPEERIPDLPAEDGTIVSPSSGGDDDFVPVKEILREFQDGVEKIIGEKDYQSHYDMGMSYKEMDLYEEALHEFEQAAADPNLAPSCHEMRGAVLLDLGRVEESIDVLRKLAAREGEDQVGIHFLLGVAYEKLDRSDDALREYRYVEERNPEFRDVRERIAAIAE